MASTNLGWEGVPSRTLVATAQGAHSPPPLDEHLLEVPIPADGWLRLMPAGPAPHRTYWAAVGQLGRRLHLDDASGQGVMAVLALQARLQDELKADYLLIDMAPGITQLGGLATIIIADTIVCIIHLDYASLESSTAVIEALLAAPRLEGDDPLRIVPVVVLRRRHPTLSRSRDPRMIGSDIARQLALGAKAEHGQRSAPFFLADTPEDESSVARTESELFQRLFREGAEDTLNSLQGLEAR